ncbi:hypothetical protein HAX54_020002 [Datura stramonium]|uniref:MADS-box domain-containing protein n=1 Tax=Datura stramonium TaxID=4076 RepID=A0ABS8S2M6_DATST|nr:hypothetical protein [Datura stramonium]
MTRNKMRFALLESITERKVSYKKRHKGILKKAHELSTLCDVEIAIIIYSPYHDEPKVFPNHDAAISILTKFRELTMLEKSENMMTQEEFTKQRIKKMEKQLQKISEAIKVKAYEEGSTSNASHLIVEAMIPDGTSSEGPRPHLLAPTSVPVSVVPLMAPLPVPGGIKSEGPRDTLLVSVKTPISLVPPTTVSMVPSIPPAPVLHPMFHLAAPLRIPSQIVPGVDPSWVPPSPLSFSQIFPPMVPQMYPPIPQQMALRRAPGMSPAMPPTRTSSLPSPVMAPPMSAPMRPPMIPQIDHLMNMPPIGASTPMNDYQNYFIDFPQGPTMYEMLDWNDDDILALFDDQSFNNINVQDPN